MAWMVRIDPADLYLSAVSLAEIRFGIEEMNPGRKRDRFEFWLDTDLRRGFSARILMVDAVVAEEAGRLISVAKNKGAKPELADALIAATARIHGLRIATLNRKHFEKLGVELVKF